MRFGIRILFEIPFFVGVILLAFLTVSEGVLNRNYEALELIRFPTNEEWQNTLKSHEWEIVDGARDPIYLNKCFVGGWHRCYDVFINGYSEWNYEKLKATQPHLLGGNMPDTERVASKYGWKVASQSIEEYVSVHGISKTVKTIENLNPKIYWVLFCAISLCVFSILSNKKRTREQGTKRTGPGPAGGN